MTDHHQPWTDEEIGWLLDNPAMTARLAGEEIGRSPASVQHKRSELRLGVERGTLNFWTDSEKEYLRATVHMTASAIAEQLGRTPSQVRDARHALSKKEGIHFGFGARKDPWNVGKRPLLARTCFRCGLLLEASWFGLDKGSWRSTCIRCRPLGYKRRKKPIGDDSAKRSFEKLQTLTRQHAHHHGQPWVEQDHGVLSDPDLSILSKALELGRTYAAVVTATKTYGYFSLIGKGDPVKGQWIIDNPSAKLAS